MTQLRQAGHCFMLTNGFGSLSTSMDDWLQVNYVLTFILSLLVWMINFR